MCSPLCIHYPLYLTLWGLQEAKMGGYALRRISSALKGKPFRGSHRRWWGKDVLTSARWVEGLLREQRRLIRTERFHVSSFAAICPYVPISNSRTPFPPDPCSDLDRKLCTVGNSTCVGVQLLIGSDWFSFVLFFNRNSPLTVTGETNIFCLFVSGQ